MLRGPWNPIDRFVLAKLERRSLTPSRRGRPRHAASPAQPRPDRPAADIAEVDAFLNDKSPNAYEKQVDRLLASPHYGERWGRIWLDAARYADSDGFEKDKPRFVWFYRDWVINALNRDLPYDQFVIEQIAGDLLPNATQDQIVATGFLRNSMINEEGGVDPEQFRMEAMFDRMDAIGKVDPRPDDPVRAVPQPQVRPDHAGRVLPDVRVPERRARSERRGLHAGRADEARRDLPPHARDRSRPAASDPRLAEADGARGKSSVSRTQPKWTVVQPDVDDISTGGQKYLRDEGRLDPRRRLRADEAHDQDRP